MNLITIGIIGAGYAAQLHVNAIRSVNSSIPIWVFDINNSHSRRLALNNNCFVACSLQELFEQCNSIIISTPSSTHYKFVSACIQHGKHVLCEKPMSNSLGDAIAMVKEINSTDTICALGYNYRFFQLTDLLIKEFPGNSIERIEISLFRLYRKDCNPEESVLIDLGSHLIDYVLFLSKQEICLPSCVSSMKKDDKGHDYYASIVGETHNGATIKIQAGRITDASNVSFSITVTGRGKSLSFDSRDNGNYKIINSGHISKHSLNYLTPQYDFFDFSHSIYRQDNDWINSIYTNSYNRIALFSDGLKVQNCIHFFINTANQNE